jgi:hypothetical protein
MINWNNPGSLICHGWRSILNFKKSWDSLRARRQVSLDSWREETFLPVHSRHRLSVLGEALVFMTWYLGTWSVQLNNWTVPWNSPTLSHPHLSKLTNYSFATNWLRWHRTIKTLKWYSHFCVLQKFAAMIIFCHTVTVCNVSLNQKATVQKQLNKSGF